MRPLRSVAMLSAASALLVLAVAVPVAVAGNASCQIRRRSATPRKGNVTMKRSLRH